MWMNEFEVAEAAHTFRPEETPNLYDAAQVLGNLVNWTNQNSDGWPYWQPPAKAAKNLMDMLYKHSYAARFGYYQGTAERLSDVDKADLTKAFRPVKVFLTKQGVDHAEVFPA